MHTYVAVAAADDDDEPLANVLRADTDTTRRRVTDAGAGAAGVAFGGREVGVGW
jgi:hypothetical protein